MIAKRGPPRTRRASWRGTPSRPRLSADRPTQVSE